MIVPLIPLFLAANLAVNESDWKYGPEAIYNLQVDAIARSHDTLLDAATTNSTLKLKCRLQSALVLSCQFEESRHVLTLLSSDKSQVMKDNKEFGLDGPGEDVFQIYFCPEGIRDIAVSSSLHPARLDMIRALVAQLNIGIDLFEATTTTFDMMERSTVGVCNTTCDLSVQDDTREIQDKSYELVNFRNLMFTDLPLKEIRKTRNLDECHYRSNYFYGSHEAARDPPSVIETIIKSSKSKMTITKNEFTSYTENELIVTGKMRLGAKTFITERISLNLEDIVPADSPIPKVSNHSRASIYPTTSFRDDSSEESNENESSSSVN